MSILRPFMKLEYDHFAAIGFAVAVAVWGNEEEKSIRERDGRREEFV